MILWFLNVSNVRRIIFSIPTELHVLYFHDSCPVKDPVWPGSHPSKWLMSIRPFYAFDMAPAAPPDFGVEWDREAGHTPGLAEPCFQPWRSMEQNWTWLGSRWPLWAGWRCCSSDASLQPSMEMKLLPSLSLSGADPAVLVENLVLCIHMCVCVCVSIYIHTHCF